MPEVALADPGLGERERAAVDRVMRSGWVSMGPEVAAFEEEFAAALGAAGAVHVSSGTAALHLAALALGWGPGDEVVVPSLTFVATAATVAAVGATPVFADVRGHDDLTLDPADVLAALTPRTQAIVAVHYGGWPADLDVLRAVAEAAGLALVEDAAHTPPEHRGGGALGTVGDVGCFSLHATKNLTAGEGGVVVARDPATLARLRALRSHAMSAPSWDRQRGRASAYDVAEVGFNYRPTDLAAAIARVQLAKLPAEQAARRARAAEYRRLLAALPVAVPFTGRPAAPPPAAGAGAHHLQTVLLPAGTDRAAVQATMRAAGVQTSVHYPPAHGFSAYRSCPTGPSGLVRTEAVAPRLLSLPLHGRLSLGDVGRVVDALADALALAGPPGDGGDHGGAPGGDPAHDPARGPALDTAVGPAHYPVGGPAREEVAHGHRSA